MKRNIQKVIKCVSCLVTCFMTVVCCLVPPARAAVSDTDIFFLTDYVYEVVKNEDTTYVDFRIDHPDGGWWQFVNSGSTYVEGTSMSYVIHPGTSITQMDFYYYYLGAEHDGAFGYNYLSLGTYNRYNTISIDCVFDFSMVAYDASAGSIPVEWESHVKYYDAEFNYLGVVEEVYSVTLPGDGTSGSGLDLTVHLDLPDGAAYIVPYQRLSFDFTSYTFTKYMTINAKRENYLQIGVLFESELTEEEIEENIASDGLNNATGDLDNAGDVLGGAMDDYNDITEQLPTVPDDFTDIAPSDDLDSSIQDAVKIFDWDKSGLNYMYGPLTLSLGLAVMFYVVFGKG